MVDCGRLVAARRHDELITSNPLYARLAGEFADESGIDACDATPRVVGQNNRRTEPESFWAARARTESARRLRRASTTSR